MEVSNSPSDLKRTAQNNPCLLVVNLLRRQWAVQSDAGKGQGRVDLFDGTRLQLGGVDTPDTIPPDSISRDDEEQTGDPVAGETEMKPVSDQTQMPGTDPVACAAMPGVPIVYTAPGVHACWHHPNLESNPHHVLRFQSMWRPIVYVWMISNTRDVDSLRMLSTRVLR